MTATPLIDDCFLHDKNRLTHFETLAMLKERLHAIASTQNCSLDDAQGRYLAQCVVAPRPVPLHDNSAVDGYAFDHASLPSDGRLKVSAQIFAGKSNPITLNAGEGARIFTGAPMPNGANSVAMQEDCHVCPHDSTYIIIPTTLKAGANRRLAGEDVQSGEEVLSVGQLLQAPQIATLASLGFANVDVFNPLKIGLISNGDELVEPPNPLTHGQVYDSNRAMIKALLKSLPVTVCDLGILPDDPEIIETTIATSAQNHDILIATGGASRGDADYIIDTIDKLGTRHLWQIAVKPGRPMSFGQIGSSVFLGLPGNPVAAFVCFLLYCRPAICLLGGGIYSEPPRFRVPAGFNVLKKKSDRREFWRAWLETNNKGEMIAQKYERDGSGLISGLRNATGFIEVDETTTCITQGNEVNFIPFSAFGLN